MAHRDYEQGYRGGPSDRDYEEGTFERDRDDRARGERDELWERNRDRGEFAGSGEFGRGRAGDWREREYRGGSREGGYEWRGGRGSRSRDFDEENQYGRAQQRGRESSGRPSGFDWGDRGGSTTGRGENFGRGSERHRGDLSARDFGSDVDDYDYAGDDDRFRSPGQFIQQGGAYGSPRHGGRSEYGSRGSGYGESGRYWGGAASGYGPSTGYGYGTAGSYLGGPDTASSRGESRQRNFSGRGPRGYKRSDERIREEVNERLTRHPDIDASDVDVRVSQCEVVLVGVVEDRKAKRIAEDIAEDVWGVDDVRNELKVRRGFLAALTGEQADEREIARTATREGASARAKTAQTGATSGTSSTTSSNPSPGT